MSYSLNDKQLQVIDLLASGYTERETYLRLAIPQTEFGAIWQEIREEIEGTVAETPEDMNLCQSYHRVERRRLEAELWASESRLAALMDTAPESIFVINGRTGKIEQVNNQALLLFGYTARELIGKEMELLVPDDLKTVHVAYRNGFLNSVRKREMGYHPPIHAMCKDGRTICLDIALTATAATDDVMVVCKVREDVVELPTQVAGGQNSVAM